MLALVPPEFYGSEKMTEILTIVLVFTTYLSSFVEKLIKRCLRRGYSKICVYVVNEWPLIGNLRIWKSIIT